MRITPEIDGYEQEDGTRRVRLRLVKGARVRFTIPGVHLSISQWDAKRRRAKMGTTNHAAINERIEEAVRRAERLSIEHPEWTCAQLREALKGPEGSGAILLYKAIREDIDRYAYRLAYGTRKGRGTIAKDVERELPRVTLQGVTAADLIALDRSYLAAGLHVNTRRTRLRKLRTMYRSSCRAHGLPLKTIFEDVIPDEVDTGARFLTSAEVRSLAKLRRLTPGQELARDAWLLSYHLGGVRFGDLCRLTKAMIKDGAIAWTAGKVPRPRWAPISEEAGKIIDKYEGEHLLPLIPEGLKGDTLARAIESANASANNSLRAVAQRAGLKPVTMHMARHSWAQAAKSATGDIHAVSRILGHANTQITERYLSRFDREAVAEVFRRVKG